MKSKTKITLIIIGIVLAVILLFVGMFTSTNNRAVFLEEQINGADASVKVQEKRRADLIYNLVDAVQDYAQYEKETLQQVIEARQQADSGNIEEAQVAINAVAEQYPDLKANENYKQLMTEMALTENMIAEHRNNYNIQVRSYNKFVRSFPNNIVLGIMGYEKLDIGYKDYDAPVDAPQNLFEE